MGVLVNTATVEPPPTMIDPVLSNNTAINPTSPPVTAAPVSITGRALRADGIGVIERTCRIDRHARQLDIFTNLALRVLPFL